MPQVPFLDICGIEAWGSVQIVGQTSFGSLFEYTPPEDGEFLGIGIPCPENTLFFFGEDQSIGLLPSGPAGPLARRTL